MAKTKKPTRNKKPRRKINWQQVVFSLIAVAMILTMLLSMIR
jgi:hypothetical protein